MSIIKRDLDDAARKHGAWPLWTLGGVFALWALINAFDLFGVRGHSGAAIGAGFFSMICLLTAAQASRLASRREKDRQADNRERNSE
jgi:hypothetical protein